MSVLAVVAMCSSLQLFEIALVCVSCCGLAASVVCVACCLREAGKKVLQHLCPCVSCSSACVVCLSLLCLGAVAVH
jgi:hypothetical protein